jgi:hypothetical protein
MERRRFLHGSAAGLLTISGNRVRSRGPFARRHATVGTRPEPREAPAPISEAERAERREAAQRLMAEQGLAGLLIEPGPTLDYFAGVSWGRSERLFGLLLPQRGSGVVIAPAFERGRAELEGPLRSGLAGGRESMRSSEEPGRCRHAARPGGQIRRACSCSRTREKPAAFQVVSGAPIVEGTRGVEEHGSTSRFANEVTLQAYAARSAC